MHVLITGGAGFLGAELALRILAVGSVRPRGEDPVPVDRLTIWDRAEPPSDLAADRRVRWQAADLCSLRHGGLTGPVDVVFHLAAAVSADCEADFDLGMSANLDGSLALLEACRQLGGSPVVVFASSVAVYGAWPGRPMPAVIGDDTLPTPRSSYGTQKLIVEQLVADYTRKGFVDGRTVRLMTVAVRPGRPNGAASGFLSGVIREPLAGLPANCPVAADTMVVVSSPERTIDGLLAAAQTAGDLWGPPTAVNLPGVAVSVGEMVEALDRVAGPEVASLVSWRADPAVAAIVQGWPARFDPRRAAGLGLTADADVEAIIRQHLDSIR
jgi:nucleoside-diphosphate-sugar epimerase